MRTSLCSFISLALSIPVSKKTTCKRSLSVPRFSAGGPCHFFIRSLTKLARINRQILLEPVLISTRAVPPLLTCKRALRRKDARLYLLCKKRYGLVHEESGLIQPFNHSQATWCRLAHTLRAEPLLTPPRRSRKRDSAEIVSFLWSRRSPDFWTSHSGFLSSNRFLQRTHLFFVGKPKIKTEPLLKSARAGGTRVT